jgi:hypothetical protein
MSMSTRTSDEILDAPEPAAPQASPSDAAGDTALPPLTSTEIVSSNSTLALYEEAIAETRTVVRDEAKEIIKTRIRELERLRATTARAEAELAKLLQKTPEEIAATKILVDPGMFPTFALDQARRRALGGR